ncbi:MAG: metallophosphoesterase [Deltaproteobacteria bacterium]|nr:metallophosphoesterase [Deltaproteobacteria bacterium]
MVKRREPVLRLLHVSDVHVGKECMGVPTERILRHAATLAEIDDRILVISGDLTETGEESQMLKARDAVGALPPDQCFVVPGNHFYRWVLGNFGDLPSKEEAFLRIFKDYLGRSWRRSSPFPRVRMIGEDYLLVGLNSMAVDRWFAGGEVGREQRAALGNVLKKCRREGRRPVIAVHHSTEGGGSFLQLDDASEVKSTAAGFRALLLCGHMHRRLRVKGTPSGRPRIVEAPAIKKDAEGVAVDVGRKKTAEMKVILRDSDGFLPRFSGRVVIVRLRNDLRLNVIAKVEGLAGRKVVMTATLCDWLGRDFAGRKGERTADGKWGAQWSLDPRTGAEDNWDFAFPWQGAPLTPQKAILVRLEFLVDGRPWCRSSFRTLAAERRFEKTFLKGLERSLP